MAEQKPEAVKVDWRQSVSWLSLFRGFRIALDVKKMLLGFVGLVATWGAFLILVWICETPLRTSAPNRNLLPVIAHNVTAVLTDVVGLAYNKNGVGQLATDWAGLVDQATRTVHDFPAFCVIFGLVTLLIWSYFGGAIARMAAVQFGRDERISFTEALTFTGRKYLSLFFAPLIPFLAIVVVSIFTGLVGLLVRIPIFGEWFGGILWILPLIVGFILALIALGGIFGMPLMHPTIGVEGSDAFDAISRSFSYVYSRPWRSAFYAVLAAVYGVIVFTFVALFAGLLLGLSRFCVEFVGQIIGVGVYDKLSQMWPPDAGAMTWGPPGGQAGADTASMRAASTVLGLWVWLVYGLVWGFAVSYTQSALTIIYFLLRKNVDNTEFDEVYLEEEEEEAFEEFGPEGEKKAEGAAPAETAPPETAPPEPKEGPAPPGGQT